MISTHALQVATTSTTATHFGNDKLSGAVRPERTRPCFTASVNLSIHLCSEHNWMSILYGRGHDVRCRGSPRAGICIHGGLLILLPTRMMPGTRVGILSELPLQVANNGDATQSKYHRIITLSPTCRNSESPRKVRRAPGVVQQRHRRITGDVPVVMTDFPQACVHQ
jgi:hypothetical protein